MAKQDFVIENGVLKRYIGSSLDVVIPNGVTEIGENAFRGWREITKITIPEGVTIIGRNAFYYCKALTEINIPNSVTCIERTAFAQCQKLTNLTIPTGVTLISEGAFRKCYSITSFNIPKGVTQIGKCAFEECHNLSSVTIPEGVTSIGDRAFLDCGVTSIVLPDSLNSIGNGAFTNNKINSIVIPDGVTTIGDHTFGGCVNLKSVVIPDGVTTIGDYTFCGCENLKSVVIPKSVESIGKYAFGWCRSLVEISVPNGVIKIGQNAFERCEKLQSVFIPGSVKRMGDEVFSGCYNLKKIDVSSDNRSFASVDGVLLNKKQTEIIIYPAAKVGKQYMIPDLVKVIRDNAFSDCKNLLNITIPDSVVEIGEDAFRRCDAIQSIAFPNNAIVIGSYAFNGCKSLKNITIPDGVTEIADEVFGDTAFWNDKSNWENGVLYIGKHLIEAKETIDENYIIKQGTVSVADRAFSRCHHLKTITVPDSVIGFGKNAFDLLDDFDLFYDYGRRDCGSSSLLKVSFVIRSSEDGSICLKTVIGTSPEKYFHDGGFDYAAFDSATFDLKDEELKIKTATSRLDNPYRLSAKARGAYNRYLRKMAKVIIKGIIDTGSVNEMANLEKYNLINVKNIDVFIDYSTKARRADFTAYLLAYKNKLFSSKPLLIEDIFSMD